MAQTSKLCYFYYLLLLLFCSSFTVQLSYCADTIIPGKPLDANRTITSSNGAFVLTYFKPGTSNKYYVGIRSENVSHKPIVWVANRNVPVSDPSSSQLKIADDGNLVIVGKYNVRIWSTNLTSISANSTQAVLLDNGNLVLIKWPSSSVEGRLTSPVLWQSFDHPTDTWLYGGKIGFSKLTNRSQMLTSWRSVDDPAEGQFSLTIDLTSQFGPTLVLLNGSEVYWRYFDTYWWFDYMYVSNENESYFSYDPYFVGSFAQLHVSGKMQFWRESLSETVPNCWRTNCGAYGICDDSTFPICKCATGFKPKNLEEWTSADFSAGCVRRTSVQCEDMKEDSFQKTNMLEISDRNEIFNVGNFKECKRKCLNDCECTAYADGNGRCIIWHGDLMFRPKDYSSIQVVYYRLPNLDQDTANPRKVIIGIVGGAVALLAFLLLFLHRYRRNQLTTVPKPVDEYTTAFSHRYLKKATQNFSEKLGEGGCGSVFKGKLPDSTHVAVKTLKLVNKGEKQFRNEVKTIGVIHHVNLIRLRGFCAEKTHRLLVYEYMPKGSLDFYLSGKSSQVLDWGTRYKIAIGAAQGLAYLHESCHECIIHCDIKPANILLDEEFNPKVADFGLAKLFDRDFSRVLTTMRGTLGYIAPEWLSADAITPKVDVYSYGMMLFEIISGRRNLEIIADDMVDYFPTRAVNKTNREEEVISLLDYKLEGNANEEELTRALRVASWCIQDAPEDRPSMKLIVQILQGVVEVGVPPVPRILQIFEEQTSTSHTITAESSIVPLDS